MEHGKVCGSRIKNRDEPKLFEVHTLTCCTYFVLISEISKNEFAYFFQNRSNSAKIECNIFPLTFLSSLKLHTGISFPVKC